MQTALNQWRAAIGDANVLVDDDTRVRYMANVSALERSVPAVLRPASTAEVEALVRVANEQRVPLYPVSCGKNWGMGSRLPVQNGSVIVDLSRMNRIRELNAEHHYAVVEPGVTQGQLHRALQEEGSGMIFNVTGSGLETSLIGNALERGVGYFASRAEALSGLEVVLGNGQRLHTGMGHIPSSAITHLYKYGIGPDMTGLFSQSNYGIVTAAGVALMPPTEAHVAMVAKIDDPAKFRPFMEALIALRKQECIRSAVHIGNRHRTVSTLGPLVYERLTSLPEGPARRARAEAVIAGEGFGPWSAVGGLRGTRAELMVVRDRIQAALARIADVTFIDDNKIARARRLLRLLGGLPALQRRGLMLDVIEPLYGLSKGIPTDQALKSAWWLVNEPVPAGDLNPDQSRSGFLYCLPMVPMSGADVEAAASMTETIFGRQNFVAYMTFNMVNANILEGVINLAFDREDVARVAAAHDCIAELQQAFIARGYIPYRLGIQSMGDLVSEKDLFWQLTRDLKQTFDPNHIIAPGRYNLV